MKNNSEKWIAVYTKPRHEKTVSNDLYKKGYEVYLPLLREKRKWSDRKKWIEFPLFKSYLFVNNTIIPQSIPYPELKTGYINVGLNIIIVLKRHR